MRKLFFDIVELIYECIEHDFKGKHYFKWTLLWVSVLGLAILGLVKGEQIFAGMNFEPTINFLMSTYALWLPPILLLTFWGNWMEYIRRDFIHKESHVILEIKVPKETNKSPLAMEIFFTALYQTGSASLIETYWKGKIRPWFSFEIVSIEGKVKFYIWAPRKWKNLIESQLYAQYPGVEIYEVPDYTLAISHDPEKLPFWATYFTLSKKDVYPIKTYVDYGLDKLEIKEEFKVDPMTSVLEYMGSLGKGEQAWIHIMIQAHRDEWIKQGRLFYKEDWKVAIDAEVEKIRKEATPERPGAEFPGFPNPTPGQIDAIKALERSKGKFPFDTAIRGIYISKKESFNPINITGLIGSFRQYNSNNLNGFKLGWFTDYDYPWQDYKRMRRSFEEQEMLEAMQKRSFFHHPFKNFHANPMILMTEELATIYHLPGGVAQTPTLDRILSKKSEPPANLPI